MAAVGVVAYSGYTAGAKHSVCKDNHKTKTIIEKKTFCEFNETIKLRKYYTGFQKGAEFDFNCSRPFFELGRMLVGTFRILVHIHLIIIGVMIGLETVAHQQLRVLVTIMIQCVILLSQNAL